MLRRLMWMMAMLSGAAGGQGVLAGTGASAVVMDVATGRVVMQTGPEVRSMPGSTLKPFVLRAGLRAGLVQAGTTVECRGDLKVLGRNLACTHPRERTVFDARGALAYSCNTYFARLAERMPEGVLRAGLVRFGMPVGGGMGTPEGRVLVALGLEGARVSPMEMARGYRRMALEPDAVVDGGLADSVAFGMADNARMPGMVGKTGTARDPGLSWTHGWFAGILRGKTVVVVYVPQGSGADAAGLAKRVAEAVAR